LGTPPIKIIARNIIIELGNINGKPLTIFDNAQNVHNEQVESSVTQILEYFSTFNIQNTNEEPIQFTTITEQIQKLLTPPKEKQKTNTNKPCHFCKNHQDKTRFCTPTCKNLYEKENKINLALKRIHLDRTLYSKYNTNLENILIKIWKYISKHEYKNELQKRLLEELQEMAGTCSSGFASRLVNVISGFDDFSIKISWEEQIIANFTGRLNAQARKITHKNGIFYKQKLHDLIYLWINDTKQQTLKQTIIKQIPKTNITREQIIQTYLQENKQQKIQDRVEEFAENVLYEITTQEHWKPNFLLFFRTFLPHIKEEMYQEFKQYLDDTTFDLYMRKAIMNYGGI